MESPTASTFFTSNHLSERRQSVEEMKDESTTTSSRLTTITKMTSKRAHDIKESVSADFRLIQNFNRISNDWQSPITVARPPSVLTAYCINEASDHDDEVDDSKIIAIGRKRKKDDTIFRLELFHKVGGQVVHTRDIRDPFAGGAMCFLTPKVICYTSWNLTTGSPLIRLFDSEKSDLGPSLHTQNFLRKRSAPKFPGGFFQNFKAIVPFILDESDSKSSELVLSPHVLAWSMEGLVCVWELTCVTACTKTGVLKLRYGAHRSSSHHLRTDRPSTGRVSGKARASDAGALRRLETFPRDVLKDDHALGLRNRILGVTISSCGSKIFVVDRYWRIWIWDWRSNSYRCIGISSRLQTMVPLKGSASKPYATFRNTTPPSPYRDVSDDCDEWSRIPKADWLLKPKQLNLVHADDSDYLIIGTKVGVHDEKANRTNGIVEPIGTLWPPTWRDGDWTISVDLVNESIVEIQESWHPVQGPGRFIFALTDREPDTPISTKKRDKRGLVLLRETDLCVVADSRSQSIFDKVNIKELQTASYPPIGSMDHSNFFENQRKRFKGDGTQADDKSNTWTFNPFSKPKSNMSEREKPAYSLYCFDNAGTAGIVGAYGT